MSGKGGLNGLLYDVTGNNIGGKLCAGSESASDLFNIDQKEVGVEAFVVGFLDGESPTG